MRGHASSACAPCMSLPASNSCPAPPPYPACPPVLQWEELQTAGREAEAAGRDPWYALQEQGVQCSESACVYLSPQQLAIVCGELERACAALDATSMQAADFYISDCLMRARMANSRLPTRSRA